MRVEALFRPSVGDCAPGTSYRVETYTYTVRIALKNDGVLAPYYGTWNAGDYADDGVHNLTYSDTDANGGYNHFELLRFTGDGQQRPDDEEAAPMQETRLWLERDIFDN